MGGSTVKSGFFNKNRPIAQTGCAYSAIFLVAAIWLSATFAQSAQAAVDVTDDRGVTVAFEHSPKRIVSLLPSLTETVCALGACDRLVGVDRFSNDPPAVAALPKLGGGIDPDIERVVALQPDLVLIATSSRAVARFEALGLKVLALEPRSSADLRRTLRTLGALLDVREAADRVWREIDAAVEAVAQSLPAHAQGARVYFEVSQGPYAAGPGSFIGEVMSRLGLRNIVPPALGPYPKLNPEFVVRADPDLILIGRQNAARLTERPGWAALRAIAQQRICAFDPAQADVLVRAGPRMAQAARLVADCLLRTMP